MDDACREHDIAYSQNSSIEDRHKADWILENRAWERVKSKNAKFKEKAAAWLVTTGMKVKRKLGMGLVSQQSLSNIIKFIKNVLSKSDGGGGSTTSGSGLNKSALKALHAARMAVKRAGGKKRIRVPRIIPLPHSGGILPLIPIFAALGALGSLAGGAGAVAKTVIDAKNAKKKLEEDQRHNKAMEAIGKQGSGLFLRKTSRGFGLYLKKQSKNSKNF